MKQLIVALAFAALVIGCGSKAPVTSPSAEYTITVETGIFVPDADLSAEDIEALKVSTECEEKQAAKKSRVQKIREMRGK